MGWPKKKENPYLGDRDWNNAIDAMTAELKKRAEAGELRKAYAKWVNSSDNNKSLFEMFRAHLVGDLE